MLPEQEPQNVKPLQRRSAARFAAVQGVYQLAMDAELTPRQVVDQFAGHRLHHDPDYDYLRKADVPLMTELMTQTWARRLELDQALAPHLPVEWALDKLESVVLAILRVASYELVACLDTPVRVILDEYIDITHAFASKKEPFFVNGVLNNLARQVRSGEF